MSQPLAKVAHSQARTEEGTWGLSNSTMRHVRRWKSSAENGTLELGLSAKIPRSSGIAGHCAVPDPQEAETGGLLELKF